MVVSILRAASFFVFFASVAYASDWEKAFKGLGECERKFAQNVLKGEGFYKSTIDGLWGKGTQRALIKYSKGRPVKETIDKLDKCLPKGATIFNAYGLNPQQKLKTCFSSANKTLQSDFEFCLNKLANSGKKFNSLNQLGRGTENCLEKKGHVRLKFTYYKKVIDDIY